MLSFSLEISALKILVANKTAYSFPVEDRGTDTHSGGKAGRIQKITPNYLSIVRKGCVKHDEISEEGTKVRNRALHYPLQMIRATLD